MTLKILIDIIGWVGAVSVLSAYFMVSFGKVEGDSFKYQFLNILGAICLIANTAYYKAYPSTVVNFIWIFIGLYSLHNTKKIRRNKL